MNPELAFTLDEAVAEVLGILVGNDDTLIPESNRYYTIVRCLNRALRKVATEAEWSWYASLETVGAARTGVRTVALRASVRPRINIDDRVRLVRAEDEYPMVWASFLPREAIDKVPDRQQLWVAHQKSSLEFSRPFNGREDGLIIQVPVMREPTMFRLPQKYQDAIYPPEQNPAVPDDIREQLVDFQWPDLIVIGAAYFYAQTDPIMQPRVQTLEANYNDLMYSLKDRDTRNTDAPFMNPYFVPIDNDINGGSVASHVPYSESRWF